VALGERRVQPGDRRLIDSQQFALAIKKKHFKSLTASYPPVKKTWGRWFDDDFQRFFPNFRRKKLAFFLNTNVMINFFQHLALF
jgi:hypothetical protein